MIGLGESAATFHDTRALQAPLTSWLDHNQVAGET